MAVAKELVDAVERMQAKDEAAFAIFYEQTYSYVYAKAKYVMHDEEDALDLTQETYIQAYKGISTLMDVNNVYAWLGGIVYRQGMRIFNKKKESLTGEEQDYLFEEMESGEATPEQVAEQQATVNIVKGMIDELPELQRVAVMAFYYDNMQIDALTHARNNGSIKKDIDEFFEQEAFREIEDFGFYRHGAWCNLSDEYEDWKIVEIN